MLTNCKNCGAVLKGSVCEYCGTVYNDTPKVDIKLGMITPDEMYKAMQFSRSAKAYEKELNKFRRCL